MQQQYCRNFLSSFARGFICLLLFAPACDYADDKIKGSPSTPHSLDKTTAKSTGYYYGLRARRSTDSSGVHRNTGVNAYYDGLNRSQFQQEQQKKRSVTRNTGSDKKGNMRQSSINSHAASTSDRKQPGQNNRMAGNSVQQKQIRKKTGNAAKIVKLSTPTGFVIQNKNPDKKQIKNSKYSSNGERKHYNNSRRENVSDKLHIGKNEQKKDQFKTRRGHHEHHKKYGKYKNHIFKRHPVSRVFFTGYSFVPHSYYTYYNYYYPGLLSYPVPAYNYSENNYVSGSTYNRESSGWIQLSNGQVKAALESFAGEMEYYPNAGIPKVGYALAVAASGDLIRAVLAMREALRFDPDSLQYIYLDEKLFNLVDELIDKYEYLLQFNNRRPDEAFMVSTLYYLERDYMSAHDAIGRAISDGDRSLSMNNLHRIINAKLQENYAGDVN